MMICVVINLIATRDHRYWINLSQKAVSWETLLSIFKFCDLRNILNKSGSEGFILKSGVSPSYLSGKQRIKDSKEYQQY